MTSSARLLVEQWHGWDALRAEDRAAVDGIVAGAIASAFERPGRTAWYRLTTPALVGIPPGAVIRAVKIKGAGFRAEQAAAPALPSATELYCQPSAHVGVDERGRIVWRRPEPAPFGGLWLERARAELETAAEAERAGCHAFRPLALYQCGNTGASDRLLGICVSGSVLADDRRASEHFLRSERFGENLPRLTELASRYGSNLRRLHAAGRFRHNGHVTNLVWAGPGAPVIFTDLDSCMRCVDVSPERWKMERLRDAASGVFNFAIAAIDPRFQIVDELEPGSFQSIATELVAAYAGQTVNGSFEDIDDHVHRRGVAVRSELGGCQESPPALRGTGYALDRLWLTCRAMEVVNRLLLDGDDHGLAVDPRSLARSIETAHPGPACR